MPDSVLGTALANRRRGKQFHSLKLRHHRPRLQQRRDAVGVRRSVVVLLQQQRRLLALREELPRLRVDAKQPSRPPLVGDVFQHHERFGVDDEADEAADVVHTRTASKADPDEARRVVKPSKSKAANDEDSAYDRAREKVEAIKREREEVVLRDFDGARYLR